MPGRNYFHPLRVIAKVWDEDSRMWKSLIAPTAAAPGSKGLASVRHVAGADATSSDFVAEKDWRGAVLVMVVALTVSTSVRSVAAPAGM